MAATVIFADYTSGLIRKVYTLHSSDRDVIRSSESVKSFNSNLKRLSGSDLNSLTLEDNSKSINEALSLHISTFLDLSLSQQEPYPFDNTTLSLSAHAFVGLIAPLLQIREEIPPDQLELIIRDLIAMIEEFLAAHPPPNGGGLARSYARASVEALRGYIARIRSGGPVPVSEAIRNIGLSILGFLNWARSALNPAQILLIWERIGAIMARFPGRLGGAALTKLLLVVAAFTFGLWIGRLIGAIQLGNMTIEQHIEEFIDVIFVKPSEICRDAFEMFMMMWRLRLQAEEAGRSTEAIRHFLDAEIDYLTEIIENECSEHLDFWTKLRRTRRELSDELAD